MGKCLVIYYSYTNNNKLIAESISKQLGFETLEIKEKKKRRSLTFMKDLMSSKDPEIINDLSILSQYDQIILVTPVWFGKLAKPMNKVLHEIDRLDINYKLISVRGGEGDDKKSILSGISSITLKMPIDYIDIHMVDYANNKDYKKYLLTDKQVKNISLSILERIKEN